MSTGRVRVGAGVSREEDPLTAGGRAARDAAAGLSGAQADLVVVFASGRHLVAPEALLEAVQSSLQPAALIGCGAGGVLGAGREHESGTAVAVWAVGFPGGAAGVEPFAVQSPELPAAEGTTGVILLADPYTFDAEAAVAAVRPSLPVIGGLASARTPEGAGALFLGDEVLDGGAVGAVFSGVEVLPCVSQGAAPLGRELTITAAEDNMILELAGRPAVETLEQVIGELEPREQALVAGGLLIGIVIDTGKPEYRQGDFLVRGVLGADRRSGGLVVGATVHPGQVVRLHARDARSADDDLRRALRARVEQLDGRAPAGALVFSCNGRGRGMFHVDDHDAAAIQEELGGAPAAGFFAAGEIGPVGGRSFLHGFTATVAVFPE